MTGCFGGRGGRERSVISRCDRARRSALLWRRDPAHGVIDPAEAFRGPTTTIVQGPRRQRRLIGAVAACSGPRSRHPLLFFGQGEFLQGPGEHRARTPEAGRPVPRLRDRGGRRPRQGRGLRHLPEGGRGAAIALFVAAHGKCPWLRRSDGPCSRAPGIDEHAAHPQRHRRLFVLASAGLPARPGPAMSCGRAPICCSGCVGTA